MLPYCTLPALLECYSKHQPPDSLNYKLKFSLLIMGVNPSNWRQELSVCIYIYIYIVIWTRIIAMLLGRKHAFDCELITEGYPKRHYLTLNSLYVSSLVIESVFCL